MLTSHRFGPMGRPAVCRICGVMLSYHQQVSGQICDDWRCKKGLLSGHMTAYREKAASVLGVRHPDAYPMVVVPDCLAATGRQPQSRRQEHINFLYDLCLQTTATMNRGDDAHIQSTLGGLKAPGAMASQVCAICKGSCCHLGGVKAFLDEAAIRRFMVRSGLRDPLEMVSAYHVFLPEIAITDSCVYQTDSGCALPRWMRAGICNAYRCQGLTQADSLVRQKDASRLFVVVRQDNRIIRAAFVQPNQIRQYPLPRLGSKQGTPVIHLNPEGC